jgi:hypothetical protein
MASLYKQRKSRFWWIKYRDPDNPIFNEHGKEVPRRESTGLRIGVGPDTRAAKELEAQRTVAERRTSGHISGERWDAWVPAFLKFRYRQSPGSLLRYETAWRTLRMFLTENKILIPRQLTRSHCENYFKWRATPDKSYGKYKAGHNTAVLEMKFLALILNEAIERKYATSNPAHLRLEREPEKKPCEFFAEDIQQLEEAIAKEPANKRAFLWPSYLIARYHCVRINETHVNPTRDVKIEGDRGVITFFQKGNRKRRKPLHPKLIPLFAPLLQAGATETFTRPKAFNKEWSNFFKRSGIKARRENEKPSSHSLRVTGQNTLRRAGISKELRMAYLSHESKKDVNSQYDRIEISEMRACHAPLENILPLTKAQSWDEEHSSSDQDAES